MLGEIAVVLSCCKATQPTGPSAGGAPSVGEVMRILDTTHSIFLGFGKTTNGNPRQAIMLTTQWLRTQPNVQAVQSLDSIYISILLKSGLQTEFTFVQVDVNGKSQSDGEDGSPSDTVIGMEPFRSHEPFLNPIPPTRMNTLSSNTIANKNVLFNCPAYSQQMTDSIFQPSYDYFTNSSSRFTVTVLKDSQCSYNTVESFNNYGFVVLRTHGGPDDYLTGSIVNYYRTTAISDSEAETIVLSQLGQDGLNKIENGFLRLGDAIAINLNLPWYDTVYIGHAHKVLVTTDYIESLHSMLGTVLFGCMCYSGQSSPVFNGKIPMETAWMNKNLISYYGWAHSDGTSASVRTILDNWMMDTLCRALAVNFDSTGHAYLDQNGNEFADYYFTPNDALFLKHFGADNYSYPPPCPDSFVDARDGQVYKTVCIGNQTWMAQNLDYYPSGSGYACYNDDAGNCATYGLLYDWNTMMQGADSTSANPSKVQGICPHGWHVPSDAEFQQLFATIGSNAAGAMKSTSGLWAAPNVGATNASGFSALPGGYCFSLNNVTSTSLELGSVAMFGTTTNTPQSGTTPSWNLWGLWNYSASPSPSPGDIVNGGNSCRCVKDP